MTTTLQVLETGDLGEVEVVEALVGGEPLTLALADEPEERTQGLRGVDELGDVDGMLFSWGGEEVSNSFTMRGTLIPLDIAFFDREGRLVDLLRMTPCTGETCPSYQSSGAFSYAVEVPAGGFANLAEDARLEVKEPP